MANTSSADLLTKINEEFLTCQICFENYTRPKSLNCQHTFCEKCLEEYLPANSASITCPTCRCVHPLTSDRVHGLKDNFFISSMADMLKTVKEIRNDDVTTSMHCETCDPGNRRKARARCLDCTDFLCQECATWHVRTKLTKNHKVVPLSELEKGLHNAELKHRAKIYCPIHDGEVAKLFCLNCKKAICNECQNSEHIKCKVIPLKEEVSNQVKEVEKLLDKSSNKATILRNFQAGMKNLIESKRKNKKNVEEMLEKSSENFIRSILKRKQQLIEELDNIYESEIKKINADEDSVSMQLSSLVSCSEFTQKVLEFGTPKEVLELNKRMLQMLKQLIDTHPASSYQNNLNYTENLHFESEKSSYSNVVQGSLGRITKKPSLVDESLKTVLLELNKFCVRNNQENMKEEPSKVENTENKKRKETVEMRIFHQQVGKQGMGDGEFESTPNIVINSANEIITSDYEGTKIQIFHPDATFKDSFITEMDQKIYKPTGVALLRNDDIVVCCETSVCVWTHEGKNVTMFGSSYLVNCTCVCVDLMNHILVADQAKHCIYVHTENGTVLYKFGSQGKAESKLIEPRYITCDSQNNIIVSDSGDCSIKKFDHRGEFLLSFGSEGPEKGQFAGPRGLCTDKFDNILVSDCWNHRVDVFTPDGCFIRHIATKYDNLHFPWAIATARNNKLVLSEDYSWSIKIFNILPISTESREDTFNDIMSSSHKTLEHSATRSTSQDTGRLDLSSILNEKVSWWLNSANINSSNTTNSSSMDNDIPEISSKPSAALTGMSSYHQFKAPKNIVSPSPTSDHDFGEHMASLSSTRSTTSPPRFGRTTSPPLNLNFNSSQPSHLKKSSNFFLESNELSFARTPTFSGEKPVSSQLQGDPMGTL